MVILGAGSQARVVIELVRAMGKYSPTACIEIGQDPNRVGTNLLGVPVVGVRVDLGKHLPEDGLAVLAIGDNKIRAELHAAGLALGLRFPVIRHPTTVLSESAELGEGTVLAALSFVGTQAKLGRGCIINTAASVDHDCVLEDYVHVAVGARLPGNVKVGTRTTIGAGAVVRPGVTIGPDVLVGAGAVVVADLTQSGTYIGNPARPI